MLKVALICVSYGNPFVTEMFVTSAIGGALSSHASVALYIVNNSNRSDDIQEIDRIASFSPHVTAMHSGSNLGYFGGINYALRRLSSTLSSYDFTVVCNNDIILTPSFFVELELSCSLGNSASVLCPQVVSSDGRYENPHVLRPPSIFREILYSVYYSSYCACAILSRIQALMGEKSRRISVTSNMRYLAPMPIYQGYGAIYILARRFFDINTILDFPGFLMFEEFFLSEQVARFGELPLFVPSIKVFHLGKATTGKSPARQMFKFAQSSFRHYRNLVPLFGHKSSLAFKAGCNIKPPPS